MKTISKPAIVALLTAALGFTSLAPSFARGSRPRRSCRRCAKARPRP
ncbi:hypothetical protein N8D56_11595 [Devosia sp. A8/3-2]|nr:hypothetical protein N8D56_11595 [Devosia sp. A8/3-2]